MNIVEMVQAETDSDAREDARLLLGKVFEQEVRAYYDHTAWDCLAEEYLHSTPEMQGVVNNVLLTVCGRSLPTLMKLAELGDAIVWEKDQMLVNPEHADDVNKFDWDERFSPYTTLQSATVTVDHNHSTMRIRKLFMEFETADDEGKKKINAELKDVLGGRTLIGVGNSNESQTERMAKLRRERKRARFSVVSNDENT
jgi:hypothetical protein